MPKKITEKLTRKLQYNELSANVWQVLRIWGDVREIPNSILETQF